MTQADPMEPFLEELRREFRIKFGCDGAELAMARELITLNQIVIAQGKRIDMLEKDVHRAFHRMPPSVYKPSPAKMSVPPVDDDSWIATGRES